MDTWQKYLYCWKEEDKEENKVPIPLLKPVVFDEIPQEGHDLIVSQWADEEKEANLNHMMAPQDYLDKVRLKSYCRKCMNGEWKFQDEKFKPY